MAKRKTPKMTPEEQAQRDKITRLLEERMAYHERMAELEEQRRSRKSLGRRLLERLKLAA